MSKRISFAVALVFIGLLSGCQSLQSAGLYYDRTQEFPAYSRTYHHLPQSTGSELRGYRVGNRHYFR